MQAEKLTLWEAQLEQPWSLPYGEFKHHVRNCEGQLKHALLHANKTLGKIAVIVERLDHSENQWLSDAELGEVGDMAADLVSVALRIGNVVGRSVVHALMRRVKEKNGNGYGEPLPENQRARFGAMICT